MLEIVWFFVIRFVTNCIKLGRWELQGEQSSVKVRPVLTHAHCTARLAWVRHWHGQDNSRPQFSSLTNLALPGPSTHDEQVFLKTTGRASFFRSTPDRTRPVSPVTSITSTKSTAWTTRPVPRISIPSNICGMSWAINLVPNTLPGVHLNQMHYLL